MLIVFSSYAGDVLTLTNQTMFDGKVTRIKDCIITFKVKGARYDIPADSIYSIQFEDPGNKILNDYIELAERRENYCMQGQMDAQNLHGKAGLHVTMGFLFGPLAVIGAALGNPSPANGKETYAMSQNDNLFSDPSYLSCYKRKAKNKNIGNAAAGWGLWLLLLLL